MAFLGTPGWQYEVEEVSANVYQVTARNVAGPKIEAIGTDVEQLLEECRENARRMSADLEAKMRSDAGLAGTPS